MFLIICVVLILLSLYIGYKHGRNVERINKNLNRNLKECHHEDDNLFIKDVTCEHEWKLFSSGYMQCKKCKSIVIKN